jgi:hypothetical protein
VAHVLQHRRHLDEGSSITVVSGFLVSINVHSPPVVIAGEC